MVHGFAVDENGQKMSKSIGNVVNPNVIINGGKVQYCLNQPTENNVVSPQIIIHSYCNSTS